MSNTDLPYWLALIRFQPFGPTRMQKLMRRFPFMKSAFEASASRLLEAGIEPEVAHRFLQERLHLHPDEELARMKSCSVGAMVFTDEHYPPLLKTLYDPPAVLFIRGPLPDPARKHLAVVGSRKATSYGLDAVRAIVEPLAKAGVVIVSGLAYGIDAASHQIALDAGGTTVAVLGSGIDDESIYPSANRTLASQILAHGGALISEYSVGTLPIQSHFPIRNRIIAGLCHGTLVVEASLKSGSLITARAALDAGRDVYAVPGRIDAPLSEGPNQLIKMGASPVTTASDIHPVEPTATIQTYTPTHPDEQKIYDAMDGIPRHIEEIIQHTHLDAPFVNRTLTLLEMRGVIRHEGGGYYCRLSKKT